MSYSSYATFVAALTDLTITGVTRVHDEPPHQLNTADLPAMYPRLPEQENEVISLGGTVGLATRTCELVFLVEPAMQNTNAANFAATVALVDAIETALTGLSVGSIDRWTIRQETATFGDTPYWALVASVEAM